MRVARAGSKRGHAYLSFAVPLLLMPSAIGSQDLASLLMPKVLIAAERQQRMIESPFGTIHAPMFRFPQPVGSMIPPVASFTRASLTQAEDVASAEPELRAVTGVVQLE